MKNDSKKIKQLIDAIKVFGEQKQISEEELHGYLVDVFKKAFEKVDQVKKTHREEGEESDSIETLPANIIVELDLTNGNLEIKRRWEIVNSEEMKDENMNIHLSTDDYNVISNDLKEGDLYEEEIDISNLEPSKLSHIKQLFIQKTREAEKLKLYNDFIDKKGQLINANVYKITENYVILDYDGVSIFMPKNEYTKNDKFIIGKPKTIYVLEVEKSSKDAQVIASRNHPEFVRKIIEREIEDVSDGIVEIIDIVREPGFKTKVVVSSKQVEVDPIGSIIGVKGQRIKNIIDELNGERVDVIKYSDNLSEFVTNVLIPGKPSGIKIEEIETNDDEENSKQITIIVNSDNFLPSIGKKGINVKLASKLLKAKIDIKTIEEAKEEKIEWDNISITFNKRNNSSKDNINSDLLDGIVDDYDFEDMFGFEDDNDDDFNEMDYMLDENQKNEY